MSSPHLPVGASTGPDADPGHRLHARVQTAIFDVGTETALLKGGDARAGACVIFVGYVRDHLVDGMGDAAGPLQALELEHYPGMTQRALAALITAATDRFDVQAVRIVHRVGRLELQEPIVYVGVTSAHRHAAFDACTFLMDQLKTTVPFWKKEHRAGGAHWVAARESDAQAAERWQPGAPAREPGRGSKR